MKCGLRIFTAFLAFVLLAAPAGLAFHSASHAHGVNDDVDCSLCILGALYSAEIQHVQEADACRPVQVMGTDHQFFAGTIVSFSVSVRGPPVISV